MCFRTNVLILQKFLRPHFEKWPPPNSYHFQNKRLANDTAGRLNVDKIISLRSLLAQ